MPMRRQRQRPVPLMASALVEVARLAVHLAMLVVLVTALLSWINPYAPLAPFFNQLARPLLAPFQRVIPPLGGIDLSPLVLLLVLQVLLIVLDSLRGMAFGVADVSWIAATPDGVVLTLHIQPGAKKTEDRRPPWRCAEDSPGRAAGRWQGQRRIAGLSGRAAGRGEIAGGTAQWRDLARQAGKSRR